MISIRGLQKRFDQLWVLRDLSLEIEPGQFLCLFGPNGAGKSTLLRILATLSLPSAGTIRIAGYDLQRDAGYVRGLVGYVAHQPMLYADLTAEENLKFFARLYRIDSPHARIAQLLERVGLSARRADRVRTYSRGMQQRLAIARALLAEPAILLLDEPDSGLDPTATDQLHDYLASAARGDRTVIMTSHNFARGLTLASRVAILSSGRITFQVAAKDISLGELEAQYRAVTRSRPSARGQAELGARPA